MDDAADVFPGVPAELVAELRATVGPDHVLTDPSSTDSYCTDWTGRFQAKPTVVVRPAETEQVTAVVRACANRGVAICPQGGNTGLVGASVPLDGGVVVSTRRLRRLDPVDASGALVTVGAGVPLGDLQRHARSAGFAYGVDLGARDSATVGGTIATNAGGNQVIRYGMTRSQLAGIEVVLADGSVVGSLVGLPKDNTGYDLPGLFCGSEGTLGIITAATLRLHPNYPERVTALCAFATVADAAAAATSLSIALRSLESIEIMLDAGFELVRSTFNLTSPFTSRHAAYLTLESADVVPVTDQLGAVVSELDGLEDAVVAEDSAGRHALWRFREYHTEAVNFDGPPTKLDVSVRAADIGRVLEELPKLVAASHPSGRVWLWGHAGDGNIHVNITDLTVEEEADCAALVLDHIVSLGGSVSAEHGVGRLKRDWLVRQRGASDISVFRSIKSALDPAGLFQPGVLLPDA